MHTTADMALHERLLSRQFRRLTMAEGSNKIMGGQGFAHLDPALAAHWMRPRIYSPSSLSDAAVREKVPLCARTSNPIIWTD